MEQFKPDEPLRPLPPPVLNMLELFEEEPPEQALSTHHELALETKAVGRPTANYEAFLRAFSLYPRDNAGRAGELPERAVALYETFATSTCEADVLLAARLVSGLWDYAPQRALDITLHLIHEKSRPVHLAARDVLRLALKSEQLSRDELRARLGNISIFGLSWPQPAAYLLREE